VTSTTSQPDPSAATFEEFVSARLPSLLRYAFLLTYDAHLAEDITQEVLVRAQARWRRLSQAGSPEAYVKRMVVNEFLSWRRSRAAKLVSLNHSSLDTIARPVTDGTADLAEREAMLHQIATLPPRQRAVIVLRYYEGLSDQEIAECLGCKPTTGSGSE
jgi:RNA polymerase sigma-70 factor (sigma-E family)